MMIILKDNFITDNMTNMVAIPIFFQQRAVVWILC